MKPSLSRRVLCSLLLGPAFVISQAPTLKAQTPASTPEAGAAVAACDQQRALALVEQQVAESKSFDNTQTRVATLVRAANLLWPHRRDASRKLFTEAYEIAVADFQQQGDRPKIVGGIQTVAPDQRFVVMSAIAKRDPDWARTLAERISEDTRRAAEKATAERATDAPTGTHPGTDVASKLIGLAQSLLKVERNTALGLARSSFRYPASYSLIFFLFTLAETDRAAADGLYREALSAYAARSANDLVYLSVYPFALNREPAPVPISVYYQMPAGFAPNSDLQRIFLEALFRQAESRFKLPETAPARDGYPGTEHGQLLSTLTTLEPVIAEQQPALAQRVTNLKAIASAASSEHSRQQAAGFERERREYQEEGQFERTLERVEREANPDKRDFAIAMAILAARDAEKLERAETLLGKVSDAGLRTKLNSYLYFRRTQQAVKDGHLDEATRFSKQVEELDYRALLSFEIANEALKRSDDKGRASELLDGVLSDAGRAPETAEKARALLGVAYLYAKLNAVRAAEVLTSAVKTINQLTEPDFSSGSVGRQLGNKVFTFYAMYQVPGVSLENVFRELGASDFEGALSEARKFESKRLRALAVLALSERCLETRQKPNAPPVKAPVKTQSTSRP